MSEKKSFARTLVTSALPYANGHIHLGHIAGAYLPADIYVRYLRLRGKPVLYVGGSDEFGVPITLTALKENVDPQDVVDRYHAANADAFAQLGISYDVYGRTTWPLHVDTTQAFFNTLNAGGYIFEESMELWYSEQSNRFLPDRYVRGTCPRCGYDNANSDECENCGAQYQPRDLVSPRANIPGDQSEPVLKQSKHWFLDLPKFQDRLREYLECHPEWRANVRGITKGWIEELRARCITRDTDWGIPIPVVEKDEFQLSDGSPLELHDGTTLEVLTDKRIYVWFDAPIGYVTNTRQWGVDTGRGDEGWLPWWKGDDTRLIHFIGKDNVPFHAVIFPAMLMGQGDYVLADQVVGNEYLNIFNRQTGKSEKGSKSRGNMISVRWALEQFPADAWRYYLCANAPESKDADFDWDEFMNRYNGELCDVVGNFIHRCLTMTVKNFDGQVPQWNGCDDADSMMLATIQRRLVDIQHALEEFRFRYALDRFIDLARSANQYFNAAQPWVTRKTDMERTATTLFVSVQVVAGLCYAMYPFLPNAAEKLASMINIELRVSGPDGGTDEWHFTEKHWLMPGHKLNDPQVLFPKIDPDRITELAELHQSGGAV